MKAPKDPRTQRYGPRRPAKTEGLDLLIRALGGPTAVAHMCGLKDPSSVTRWRTGEPIPAEYARFLYDCCMEIIGALQAESGRLKREEIPQAEYRYEQRVRHLRELFFKRFGRMPTDQPIRQRPRLQGLRW